MTTELSAGVLYAGIPPNWAELSSKERARFASRIHYRRYKAKGKCPKCGKDRQDEGYITCRRCGKREP